MSKATFELDFFQMEKQNASKPSSPERTGSSLRGIQSVVSRINPQLLKTVMASGATSNTRSVVRTAENLGFRLNGQPFPPSNPPRPTAEAGRRFLPPPLPVLSPASRSASESLPETAPLTIFYNGTVTAFDVPRDQAEAIIKLAENGNVGSPAETSADPFLDGNQIEGDLPIARRKSLQRFLEKRKERLASVSPYQETATSYHSL